MLSYVILTRNDDFARSQTGNIISL